MTNYQTSTNSRWHIQPELTIVCRLLFFYFSCMGSKSIVDCSQNIKCSKYSVSQLSRERPLCWLEEQQATGLTSQTFRSTFNICQALHKSMPKHQGLQILLMSGVSVTSASQMLESFWDIWSQVSQRKKLFSDFPARGPGMYTKSWRMHEVAVVFRWPRKLKSMMAVIE